MFVEPNVFELNKNGWKETDTKPETDIVFANSDKPNEWVIRSWEIIKSFIPSKEFVAEFGRHDNYDFLAERLNRGEFFYVPFGQIKLTDTQLCPLCKKNGYRLNNHQYALSRRDNKTEICSDCGEVEALMDYVSGKK